jgi:hypothetical protein
MDVSPRLFYVCVVLYRELPCDELIPRPRNSTVCLRNKKLKWNKEFHGCPLLQSWSNKKKRESERMLIFRSYDDRPKNDAGKVFGFCSKHENVHTFPIRVISDIKNIVSFNIHLNLYSSCSNKNVHINNNWIVVSCSLVFAIAVISVSTTIYRHKIS